MKLTTTTPKPTIMVELDENDIREAITDYLRKTLCGSGTKAPKPEDIQMIEAVAHGAGGNNYQELTGAVSLEVSW